MGHIRITFTLALIAAVAAGCAADTADPGPYAVRQDPPDRLTCIIGTDWRYDTLPHSQAGYPLMTCWTGGPEDMDSSPELDCARSKTADLYACVDMSEPGVWYAFEGGVSEQVKIPGASTNFQGKTDAFAVVYAGPAFEEIECGLVGRRSPMLVKGWCE